MGRGSTGVPRHIGDPASGREVFAPRSRRRPRWVAAGAGALGLVTALYVAVLFGAALVGPQGPGRHLPKFERYDTAAVGPASPLINDDRSSVWPLLVAVLVVVAVVAWITRDGIRRRRANRSPQNGSPRDEAPVRRPPYRSRRGGRWWPALAVLMLAALAIGLCANDYTTANVARDQHIDDGVAALPVGTGPVLEITDDGVRSVRSPAGHVALTFDDGPDPRWTPAILDVLKEERVPGTFFVIGQHVVEHPEIVRRILRQGGEVGVHTYRHFEITTQSAPALRRDLRLTQLAIMGATGRRAALFRPPFITDRSNVGLHQYVALRDATADGYITVLADRDSTDWSRPGANAIALRAMPRFGAGAIIELHDGGGDRAQTVAGLRTLIRLLKAEGYQFDTVSRIARLSQDQVMPAASLFHRAWGQAFVLTTGWTDSAVWIFALLMFGVAMLTMVRVGGVAIAALRSFRRSPRPVIGAANLPAASVIVAAYNEESSITATLTALCVARAGDLQIVVVDDGSTDDTATRVHAFPDPRVELLSVPHAGKAAALAAGLNRCSADIIVTVDADTRVAVDGLAALIRPFADPAVGGVSGNLEVARKVGLLGAAQHLEYVIGNAFDRRALDTIRTQVTIPGAMGAFRRAALAAAGGFDGATLAEDTDLTLALVQTGWDLRFAPEARAETYTPMTVRGLWRQRSRWSFGIAQAVWRRRCMARHTRGRPRVGATWCFVLVSQIVLPIAAPLVDLAAVWGLATGTRFPLWLWLMVAVTQLGAAAIALRIEGQSLRWLWALPLHLFGYRQITSFVVIQTAVWAAVGRRPGWGANPIPKRAPVVSTTAVPSESEPIEREAPRPERRAVPRAA